MQLHFPLNPTTGAEDATQLPWTNGVPSTGVEGSYPPFTAVVEPMTELANLIAQAGLTGTSSDLFQAMRAIRSGQLDFDATDIGSANAALCQVGIPYTAIQAGLPFTFIKGASANTTTVPTLTITDQSGNNGLTGTIVKNNGSALAVGDLPALALITVRAISATKFALVSLLTISDVLSIVGPKAAGRLLNVQIFSTSGTYTPSPGTAFVVAEGVGAGGGGSGAATNSAGNVSLGSPGSAGSWGKGYYTIAQIGASQAVTIGAGGGPGVNGGATSLGSLLTLPGGVGGSPLNNVAPPTFNGAGSIAGAPTGANIASNRGIAPQYSLAISASAAIGGAGGSSPFGTSGANIANANGAAGTGNGSGGSGTATLGAAASVTGGSGAPGLLIIMEYGVSP